jgi:hypothetical protein
LLAGVFFLAMDFRVRTCSADQGTRLRFFAIVLSVGLDGELQLFGGSECDLFARFNDRFARRRSPVHLGSTLSRLQNAKPRISDALALLKKLGDELYDVFQKRFPQAAHVSGQLMPEFGGKGKENFMRQFRFFARFSVHAIRKVRKS